MTMKKQYIAPQMETYYIQSADSLLTTSNLVPVDGGGGSAGSQFLDETDLLQGNDDMNVILKELGM